MKKNILLFILLLFGGSLVAQDLEVVKFSPCELVRTKNFANLILGEDSTGTSSKPNMSFLFSKKLALPDICPEYDEKSEIWLIGCLERIFEKNSKIKRLLKKLLQESDVYLFLYFDRKGKVSAVQFVLKEHIFKERMRKSLCEFQKLLMNEKVNFVEFSVFLDECRYGVCYFNITTLVLKNKIKLE